MAHIFPLNSTQTRHYQTMAHGRTIFVKKEKQRQQQKMDMTMPIHLYVVCSCFHTTASELSS